MYRIFFLFMLTSFTAKAQIQFWTKEDMLDKQFEQARKEMKIKTAFNYVTSENWRVSDSSQYNEIFEYDEAGRKTGYKIYKNDWAARKRYFQYIDSFFYNDKGIFTGMKRYNPKSGGNEYALEYAAKSVFNTKGQVERMNFYRGYYATELDSYDVYAYDGKNRVIKVSSFSKDGKKDYEWKIDYDAGGRIIKVRAGVPGENFTDYLVKYNSKGLMSSYAELYQGKEKNGETTYTYDDKNRLLRKDYKTDHSYKDTTMYWYIGDEKFYHRTYLKFPRLSGSDTDFSHEFRPYKFEFYQ